jgi:4-amino-4-deoxy-L-arabinose transferase-like glycosyltransferase
MKISRNKIQQLIVALILLSLMWANFNVFYFIHTHVDENGNVIVHAHPYHKEGQKSPNVPNHTHSKSEFTLVSLIYQVLTLFTLCLLFFVFLFYFNLNQKINFSFQWNPAEIFCNNIVRRGPPSLLQFV